MNRLDKVNQQLKREISVMLQRDLNDPRLEFILITRADITRDLKLAKIYFRVIGNEEKVRVAKEGLDAARGMIRKLIGERIKMRYTPELNFFYDESVEQAERIEEIIQDIHQNEHSENH